MYKKLTFASHNSPMHEIRALFQKTWWIFVESTWWSRSHHDSPNRQYHVEWPVKRFLSLSLWFHRADGVRHPYYIMTSSNGNISALGSLYEGNPPMTGGFPSQRPVTRSFDIFFNLRTNKQLSKQSRRRWFEPPLRCTTDLFSNLFDFEWERQALRYLYVSPFKCRLSACTTPKLIITVFSDWHQQTKYICILH